MAFEERIDTSSSLHDVTANAIINFENKAFPSKKEEAWKYTSLNAILKNDFTVFPKKDSAIEFNQVKKYFIPFYFNVYIFSLLFRYQIN